MLKFPENFWWGSSTSAYQVEGGNSNSDWWHWEKNKKNITPSGAACRHYELFREDFELAKSLNHNAHRFSVEWSRVQPKAGEFSEAELKHYADVVDCLRGLGIEPVVTLHHFTNPLWLSQMGGWENKKTVDYFLSYVEKIISVLSGKVRYWVTINEPMVYTYYSYLKGDWPPQEKSFFKAKRVSNNLIQAHIDSYRLIHAIYKKNNLAPPKVSIAQNMVCFSPCKKSLRNNLAVYWRNKLFNFRPIDKLRAANALDYIGLNYYSRNLIDTAGWSVEDLLINTCGNNHDILPKNSLGWEIYPQGLFDLLAALKKYKLPVFILENGICTEDDNLRWDYIRGHLKQIRKAMDKGVEVSGYLYWSLMDNFEWDKGFAPRFGLCAVDYSDFRRSPRESAKKFAQLILNRVVEE